MKVELVDWMGDDLSVVNAARVSFAKQSEWDTWGYACDEDDCADAESDGYTQYKDAVGGARHYYRLSDKDTRLIRFLAREKHELPFAHTAMTLRCSAPVPIRTQCFKSKIGFVENEESRRYISSEPEIFIPDEFRSAVKNKKQGSGGKHPESEEWIYTYKQVANKCMETYTNMIADGLCPEQARFILPQGVMVNWIWTGSLLAYARFYNLRSKPDAQKEVQVMAEKVGTICAELWPVSWRALTEYNMEAYA